MRYLEEFHEDWVDNYRFLYKFDHYEDRNANECDRRRVKPRGRQSAAKHRHKIAQVMKQAYHLTTRPVDMVTDPQEAAAARWWLQYKIEDPQRLFKRKLRRALSLAMGAGAGALGLGCRYDLGRYPVITPYLLDPRCVTWTPGFQDPDDCETPWVTIEEQYPIDYIESMAEYGWKNTKDLRPDVPGETGLSGSAQTFDKMRPISTFASAGPNPGQLSEQRLVRVLKRYYRFDRTRANKNVPQNRNLDPQDWYMACPTCGYQDRSQEGQSLPEIAPCPQCQKIGQVGMVHRIQVETPIDSALQYPMGHRLVIIAPTERRKFFDDAWPHTINGVPPRNVPLAFFRGYDVPLEPWGSCDTSWDWSYQVIANALMRRGYEQMSRSGGVIISSGQLYSGDGQKPFEFSDKPISLARWKGQGEPQVRFFQPEGLPSSFVPFKQLTDADFRSDMGTGDVSLNKDQLKGVNVGTIQMAEKSGEIPVDDQAEQFREVLSGFFGTWYDMAKAVMTEREVNRVRGPNGAEELRLMRGEDQPNVDVLVGAQPSWDQYDGDLLDQVTKLLQAPPEAIPLLAEISNTPPDMVAKVMDVAQKIQARMNPMPPGLPPGMPPPPGAGGPPGPPVPPALAARMGGGPPGMANVPPRRNGVHP